MQLDFQILTDIAIRAALEAGKIIQQSINKEVIVEKKEGGNTYASQIITTVDKACEKVILSHLLPTCKTFDIALLSEETEDDKSRFEKDFFWCIDPMDGTLAFINKHAGFSISIALVAKDGTPQIGVVYDPSRKNLYYAIKDKGAFKNRKPWKLKTPNQHLTYITDKKLSNTLNKSKIKEILNDKTIALGVSEYKEISGAGAVLNAIFVAENTPAMLLKLPKKEKGGGSIWDFAATACIFKELGLQADDFSGNPLELNRKESTFMNHQGVFYLSFLI
ncbi:3'(2'),5'-bisphosphate nucleotidase CysQ family protein [Polaribacter porphyrae]|uniref:Inositol monophosphatase n=1 Tax=Polaribacter porphyrae TaxID=1137780 RepID=A0A2S7WPK4_9FLAO|nr:inositol monophosphatase family protein [Polaribacter porphyrae]PQJ79513.1 inositol monophosphatase [Polaribacter porphyrae]